MTSAGTRPRAAPTRSMAIERTCSARALESWRKPVSDAGSKAWNGNIRSVLLVIGTMVSTPRPSRVATAFARSLLTITAVRRLVASLVVAAVCAAAPALNPAHLGGADPRRRRPVPRGNDFQDVAVALDRDHFRRTRRRDAHGPAVRRLNPACASARSGHRRCSAIRSLSWAAASSGRRLEPGRPTRPDAVGYREAVSCNGPRCSVSS